MSSLVWDGSSLYTLDGSLVVAPGDCCCCDPSCSYGSDPVPECDLIGIRCSGINCQVDSSPCIDSVEQGMIDQGWTINIKSTCCHCDGYRLSDVVACCDGEVNHSEYVLIAVDPTCVDCETINTSMEIVQQDGEDFWKIPLCSIVDPTVYCVEDTYP